ncbi:amino acid adenylation domain-containing protein [Nonomuraea fuscirosea]|uniref:amino acid adenylation domain-containing protein n=1 Tax=Nonomuraea fuscirosea TaxID=1291556 RepID=UPI00379CD86D
MPEPGSGGDEDVYVLPASFGQERLWWADQAGAGSAYNMCGALRLRGTLDPTLLEAALRMVVARHEVLRTTFEFDPNGSLLQAIHPGTGMPVSVSVHDVRDRPECGDRDAAARSIVQETLDAPFDLMKGALLRAVAVRLADDEWVLGVGVHHIVCDGWSLGILIPELAACYVAVRDGTPPDLPGLPVQYGDWAAWQRQQTGSETAGHLAHWREQLRGASSLQTPSRPARDGVQSWRCAELPLAVPDALLRDVRALAKEERATPFMVLLAAFAGVLSRWYAQDDLLVGTVTAGRSQVEMDGLIGFFVNTLPIRVRLDPRMSFRTLLRQLRRTCLDAYAHQDLPYEKIVEQAGAGRSDPGRVMFALQNLPEVGWQVPGLTAEPFELPPGHTWLELGINLTESGDGTLRGQATYAADLWDEAEVAALLDAWTLMLAGGTADPDAVVARVPLAGAASRARLVNEVSGAAVSPNSPRCLHQLIETAADAWPDEVAVVGGEGQITFRELEERANRMAWWLREQGVGPESLVGVCLPRSVPLIVALVAVLKAGAAYVPLDPEQPPARLALFLEDARPGIVLVAGPGPASVAGAGRVVSLEALKGPSTRPPNLARPENLAYVIYTSGSTGRPKGVMVPHAAIVNRVLRGQETCPLGPGDGLLSTLSIGADAFGAEWIAPLISGAKVVVVGEEERHDPARLAGFVTRHRVTAAHFTPSMLHALLAEPRVAGCAGVLRHLKCGGEDLTREVTERHFRTLPGTTLSNEYGPTEAAIDVTSHRADPSDSRWHTPIGGPRPGVRLYVLDEHAELLPYGLPGELYIGGIQLARGYAGSPGLTAERFVPDPFGRNGRLYRTGDRVRWLAGGVLEFLGRMDEQVKVRGHRIEPGEVEAVLGAYEGVARAAVVVDSTARLVAYLACEAAPPALGELRAFLRARLPAAAIPEAFLVLPALPLSQNGKVDRAALLTAQGVELRPSRTPLAPRTPVERALTEIWRDVLGRSDVGVRDDFYEFGGNSIRAVTVFQRAAELGLPLPLKAMLGEHTIEHLATQLGDADHASLGSPGAVEPS